MSDSEWFFIVNKGKKDEQIRDFGRNLLPSDNDGFTIDGHVPIVEESTDTEEEKCSTGQ